MLNNTFSHLRRCGLVAATLCMALLASCASSSNSDAPSTTPSPAEATPTAASAHQVKHAECLVCKKNADLACVDVDVDKVTPTALYLGQAYYFCSQECKHDFEKNPAKYVKK